MVDLELWAKTSRVRSSLGSEVKQHFSWCLNALDTLYNGHGCVSCLWFSEAQWSLLPTTGTGLTSPPGPCWRTRSYTQYCTRYWNSDCFSNTHYIHLKRNLTVVKRRVKKSRIKDILLYTINQVWTRFNSTYYWHQKAFKQCNKLWY